MSPCPFHRNQGTGPSIPDAMSHHPAADPADQSPDSEYGRLSPCRTTMMRAAASSTRLWLVSPAHTRHRQRPCFPKLDFPKKSLILNALPGWDCSGNSREGSPSFLISRRTSTSSGAEERATTLRADPGSSLIAVRLRCTQEVIQIRRQLDALKQIAERHQIFIALNPD